MILAFQLVVVVVVRVYTHMDNKVCPIISCSLLKTICLDNSQPLFIPVYVQSGFDLGFSYFVQDQLLASQQSREGEKHSERERRVSSVRSLLKSLK